jgi:hypothetical protein
MTSYYYSADVLRRDLVLFGVTEEARSFSSPADDDITFTDHYLQRAKLKQ